MSYEGAGAAVPGVEICCYGASRLPVRGPRRELQEPYLAFLGGSDTFGRHVPRPFPDLVEAGLGRTCVNLGAPNAGLDSYLNDPVLLDIAAGAHGVVVQLAGISDLGNRFFRVHPRRNDRFLEPTPLLRAIYRDVDFTEFSFNRHMLASLEALSAKRFAPLRDELRRVWLARMKLLIGRMRGRVTLLWLHYDGAETGFDVARSQVEELRPLVQSVLEFRVLGAEAAGEMDDMVYAPLQAPAAARLLGPASHARIATRLCRVLKAV